MRRAIALIASVFAAFACLPPAAQAAPPTPGPKWVAWDHDASAAKRRHVAALTFDMLVKRDDNSATPSLRITAPGKPPLEVQGAQGLTYVSAAFTVLSAVGTARGPIILFRSFTGGAHCCDQYKLIQATATGWAVHDAGEWDGEGPEPADVDHDGRLELVAGDMRFDYRLTDHAQSLLPPVILAVRNGVLVNISAEPRFRPFFRSKVKSAREACVRSDTQIGPCLGYVAVAARAGQAAEALKLFDSRQATRGAILYIAGQEGPPFVVPEHCGDRVSGSAFSCENEEPRKTFTDRRKAVVWFLTDIGYLPKGTM